MTTANAPNHLNTADRSALARMVMRLMDLWVLDPEQQADLLDVRAKSLATLVRYRTGSPISPDRDQLDRVRHLIGIHNNLRLLFPQNRDLAYRWMTTSNKAFEGFKPVEVVQKWGFTGLLMVHTYLDRAIGHRDAIR